MMRERQKPRRLDDLTIAAFLQRCQEFAARWKVIVSLLTLLGGVVVTTSAYLGAYLAIPSRVTNLETKVDSSFRGVRVELDSIRSHMRVRDSLTEKRDEKLDLLLRLNCPGAPRPDLIAQCRPYERPERLPMPRVP